MDEELLRVIDLFDEDEVMPASKMKRPQSAIDREMFENFNKRNPRADGGRIGFQDGLGPRDKIDQLGVGKKILKEYSKGAGTIELGKKYGVSRDTVNRYIKKFNPNLIRQSPPKVNQYNFDYSILDDIKNDAKTMSRKEILKKYKGKISKKRLDKEKLTFGKVEESGRPRIPPGERSPKLVKRANRIKNAQGFDVSGTFAKNFHHIFPIGGLSELSAQDVMILDKKFNETLGGFNLQLNDIADEIGNMDLSDPNALKKLNDLNAKSKNLVDRAKAKLPKNLKNAIGYIEYQPVFDENGTIFELSQVRKGVDKNPSALTKFGNKKFKDYTKEEIKNFKKEVKSLANFAEKKGTMLAAKVPGVETLLKAADNIKGDIKKKKFLKAGFKTLGIAVGAPLVAYDTYKAYKQGKPVLEALEQGFIGTDLIGGTKRILSLTPEERTARSVVKQDELKNLNLDMPMGFGFIEGPTPDTDMTLQEAQQKMDAGIQRVKEAEAQKNLLRSQSRGFGTPVMADEFLAGGGIAGLSGGIDEGPQRTSMNPDSQGLSGLLKRVKKG